MTYFNLSNWVNDIDISSSEKNYDLFAIRYGGHKDIPSSHFWCFRLAGPDGDESFFYPLHRYNPYEHTSIWTITGIGCPFATRRDVHSEYRFATIPGRSFRDCFVMIEHSVFNPIYPTPEQACDAWAYNCAMSLYKNEIVSKSGMYRFDRFRQTYNGNLKYWAETA